MDIPPLFLEWFARPTFYYTTEVIFLYSVHRHLHLLFPQLSWGIDTVSFITITCLSTFCLVVFS